MLCMLWEFFWHYLNCDRPRVQDTLSHRGYILYICIYLLMDTKILRDLQKMRLHLWDRYRHKPYSPHNLILKYGQSFFAQAFNSDYSSHNISEYDLAGFPDAIVPGLIFPPTTASAATTAPLPILAPRSNVAFTPIQT